VASTERIDAGLENGSIAITGMDKVQPQHLMAFDALFRYTPINEPWLRFHWDARMVIEILQKLCGSYTVSSIPFGVFEAY
jgi:hypothetical protein